MKHTIAFVISRLFGPETVAAIGIWAAISFRTDLDWRNNLWFVALMFFINIVAPWAVFVAFFLAKKITDIEITDRKQRPPVLVAIQMVYTVGLLFAYVYAPSEYFHYAVWIYLSMLVLTIISFYWKISLHTGVNSIMFTMWYVLIGVPLFPLTVCMLFIGWARYELKKHTVIQLFAGAVLPVVLFLLLR